MSAATIENSGFSKAEQVFMCTEELRMCSRALTREATGQRQALSGAMMRWAGTQDSEYLAALGAPPIVETLKRQRDFEEMRGSATVAGNITETLRLANEAKLVEMPSIDRIQPPARRAVQGLTA